MRIGICSQNFRTITGHAGKTRRFIVFEVQPNGKVKEAERLDMPKAMSLHEFRGTDHPLFDLDVIVTASCGEGFLRRLAAHGVSVVATSESDPVTAATALASNQALPAASPHEH
jgi:predicted Fe-Mo cluster-binding NifX family protein